MGKYVKCIEFDGNHVLLEELERMEKNQKKFKVRVKDIKRYIMEEEKICGKVSK
jgi:hypothetical protein